MKKNVFLKIIVIFLFATFFFFVTFFVLYFTVPRVKNWANTNIFQIEQTVDPPENKTLEELQEQITQLNENVNSMIYLLGEKETQIQVMTVSLDEAYTEINTQSNVIDALCGEMESKNNTITILENRLETLSEEQAQEIAEIRQEIEMIKAEIIALQTDLSQVQVELQALNNTVATLEFDIQQLQSEVVTLQNDIAELQATVTELQTNFENLQNKIDYVINSGTVPNNGSYEYEYRVYKSGKIEVTGYFTLTQNATLIIPFEGFEMPNKFYRIIALGEGGNAEWTNGVYYKDKETTSVTVGHVGSKKSFQFIILYLGLN